MKMADQQALYDALDHLADHVENDCISCRDAQRVYHSIPPPRPPLLYRLHWQWRLAWRWVCPCRRHRAWRGIMRRNPLSRRFEPPR